MRFDSLAIWGLGLVATAYTVRQVDSFMPIPLTRTIGSRYIHPAETGSCGSKILVINPFKHGAGTPLSQLFMVDDDEEEDDDDDDDDDDDERDSNDPLGNGIDSVSWLPTVVGAKGKEISTPSREVSQSISSF
jgi:hypothetical protein